MSFQGTKPIFAMGSFSSLDMAHEYIDDEENRKKLIKKGAEIAANAVVKKMTREQP